MDRDSRSNGIMGSIKNIANALGSALGFGSGGDNPSELIQEMEEEKSANSGPIL